MTRKKKEIQESIDDLMERVNTLQVGEAEEEAQIKEMCGLMVESEDRHILDEIHRQLMAEPLGVCPLEAPSASPPIYVQKVVPVETQQTTLGVAKVERKIASWEQVKNQLHSVSAMKKALTGERITHGDAIAIFKTDAHRKLYEAWALAEKAKLV